MSKLERNLNGIILGAGLALGAAACNQEATGPAQPALSQAQADSLAQAVTADLDALVEDGVIGYSDFAVLPAAPMELGHRPGSACVPGRSPAPPTNSDADPVPDSVRLDFSGCLVSTPRATITYGGTVDVIDPTPRDSDRAVKTVYTDFTRTETGLISGKTKSVKQNGARLSTRTSSALHHEATDFRTDFTFPDGSTASHVKDWSSTFTADVPGSVTRGPLPSGTWDIGGTSSWTRRDRSYALTVKTDPALHYDASCTEAPKFDAGRLTAEVTRGEYTSTVTIDYTACGEYTVRKS